MGYSISHGGTNRPMSYLAASEIGEEVKKAATWSQWRQVKALFASRTDCWFEIKPRQAADMGAVLIDISARLHGTDRDRVVQIGQSALRAATRNEPWRWS